MRAHTSGQAASHSSMLGCARHTSDTSSRYEPWPAISALLSNVLVNFELLFEIGCYIPVYVKVADPD